jgi:hypothetical protein
MVNAPGAAKTPDSWRGSDATYAVFTALIRAGKEPGVDFSYQPRTSKRSAGVAEADFMFHSPPDLAMQVQEPFHSHHSGISTHGTDVMAKAQLAGYGIVLIMLGYEKLMQDPDWLVSEALQYRDHTWE